MNNADARRWKKLSWRDINAAETLLQKNENLYTGASGRFLKRSPGADHVWILKDREGTASALLIHSKRTLFPVFQCGALPIPRFMGRFYRRWPLHAIQGLREEAALLEDGMAQIGLSPRESIDYELMALDREPDAGLLREGPKGLILRPPRAKDVDDLFILQSGYEREEVLPAGVGFNPAVCRWNLERILAKERVLAAELDGRIVGKINTSADSFTRSLIGGVYVHPDFRNRGIAQRMTAEFTGTLIAEGRGISLFVKKRNPSARTVYRRLGFTAVGDYRISYY
jgi:ribosomal protein S18 acetylase RimI-like enzyme